VFADPDQAEDLQRRAAQLRERFETAFWCEDLGTYALALDGDKRPCKVLASNAGHALFSGIASPEHARRVAALLLTPRFQCGWGIRTLAAGEPRYNPMSYHNGTVWPHDNAIIAAGLARYGYKEEALNILTSLFEASHMLDLHRLPELFCGFERLAGLGPTLYPVACSPQAWAAGAVFQLLESCLGVRFAPHKPRLCFDHPRLPHWLDWLEVKNLHVGATVLDLHFRRHPQDVGIQITRREGDAGITVLI
jgi:glycogen debranching enzyme